MQQISIEEVLSIISDSDSRKTFMIQFVRSTGNRLGSLKTVLKARKGAPRTEEHSQRVARYNQDGAERKLSLHIDNATIPMTNIETNEYFTPLISHIVLFNHIRVRH